MQIIKRITVCLLAVSILLLLCACADQNRKVIGTAVGCDVYYEELRFVTLSCKDELAAKYGSDIWDTSESSEKYRAELEEMVWDRMLNNYAVLAACLKYGYSVDDLENDRIVAAVDKQVEEAIAALGSEDEFEKALAKSYTTESFLRFSLAVQELENELRYALIDAGVIEGSTDAFMDWLEDGNAVYVQHILIRNDEGDDHSANRALAENLRTQLIAGETTIDKLVGVAATNEDVSNIEPYYIVRDVYDPTFEAATLVLEHAGDVSEVVETDLGYYVFVRLEEEISDGVNLTMLKKVDALFYSYQWTKVEDIVQAQRANVQLVLNDFGKSIDLLEIK